jgi:ketosteroid isomerase-like protein
MELDRRHLALPMLASCLLTAMSARAEGPSSEERALLKQVEAFRDAQRAKDATALAALCMDELSYSHSSAVVQDKATFLTASSSPKSKVVFINYDDIWLRVLGDVAMVRFHWTSESESVPDGKRSTANLHVLRVWVKHAGTWKLLARAATTLA